MMKGKVLVSIIILMVFFLTGAFGGTSAIAADKPIVWKVSTPWPKPMWAHKAAESWAKDVEKISGGRMKIKLFSAGEIVPPFELFDAVRQGILDAGHGWAGYGPNRKFAAANIFASTPAFFDLLGYFSWMQAGGGKELYQETYGDSVVVFPAGMFWAEGGGWFNKKIQKLEDFKGLKFRTALIWGQILSEAGASVVTLPPGDIVPALQRGTLDAAEFSTPEADRPFGFHEVARCLHFPGLQQIAGFLELIINPKKWAALPDELKEIVKVACDAGMTRTLGKLVLDDCKAVEFYQSKGTQIVKFPKEMQEDILKRFVKAYNTHPDPQFKKVWESQKAFMKTYLPYMELQRVDIAVDFD